MSSGSKRAGEPAPLGLGTVPLLFNPIDFSEFIWKLASFKVLKWILLVYITFQPVFEEEKKILT